jgi:hypothetical protein
MTAVAAYPSGLAGRAFRVPSLGHAIPGLRRGLAGASRPEVLAGLQEGLSVDTRFETQPHSQIVAQRPSWSRGVAVSSCPGSTTLIALSFQGQVAWS